MDNQVTTRPLTKEEHDALSKDIMDVLVKHNAELGVQSTITLMKREDVIPSPYGNKGEEESEKEPDTKTTESGEGDGGESS